MTRPHKVIDIQYTKKYLVHFACCERKYLEVFRRVLMLPKQNRTLKTSISKAKLTLNAYSYKY